jgi:hypothetical protein
MTFNHEVIVGDFSDGRIYAFDLNMYADDDQPQRVLLQVVASVAAKPEHVGSHSAT